MLGACLYALSGFAVYNVFFNHFVDVVALFPYLLWALDEAMYNKRHGLFAFWAAVNLLNNYFFLPGRWCSWPSTLCASSPPATTA